MNSKTEKDATTNTRKLERSQEDLIDEGEESGDIIDQSIENIYDDNLTTLEKIHAILINCINLSKKQKLEFADSERYFMKLYLKKLIDKLKRPKNP